MGQTREHERMTPLRRYLRERRMTLPEAAKKCGVTMATMEIVASGSPTLPCLAIQIGKGLGLTREEVKPLGKPLQSDRWGKEGLPKPLAIDVNPHWYKALPAGKDEPECVEEELHDPGYYVDVLQVTKRLAEMGKEQKELASLGGCKSIANVNGLRRVESREKYLKAIALELGVDTDAITTMSKPEKYAYTRFCLDAEAVERIMERPENALDDVAMRFRPGRKLKDARYTLRKRLSEDRPMEIETAKRLAAALGVEMGEIGHRVIVQL